MMESTNGKRQPPRPKIEIRAAPDATPEEAAAIAAALEQFLVETAPVPQSGASVSPWQEAALREGIGARRLEPGGWGPTAPR